MAKVNLNDPQIGRYSGATAVYVALQLAGLAPPKNEPGIGDFPAHWAEGLYGDGWYTMIVNGRVWVAPSTSRGDKTWFDSIEEADAWVLACWRMR